ncbi:MAG: hypothetical protein AB1813_15915, partial [Verrucomicrobiota bacterium]
MSTPLSPPPAYGTSVVDRMNLVLRLRRYLKLVLSRWWILALTTLIGLGAGYYMAKKISDLYRASRRITVAPRIIIEGTDRTRYLEALDKYYEHQALLLNGVVQSRVHQIMLNRKVPIDPNFRLSAVATPGPSLFQLTVECTDFDYATNFVATWAREYLLYKQEEKQRAMGGAAANVQDEVIRLERKLEEARAAKQRFLRTNNIGNAQEAGKFADQQLNEQANELLRIQTQRQLLEQLSNEDLAKSGLPGSGTTAERNTGDTAPGRSDVDPLDKFTIQKYEELRLEISSKQAEKTRWAGLLKPQHPYMQELDLDLERLKRTLDGQLALIEEKRKAMIDHLKKKEQGLENVVAELRKKVLESSAIQNEYSRLEEEENNIKDRLTIARRNLESVNNADVDQSEFAILEEPLGVRAPTNPLARRNMVMKGLAIGFAVGLGIIFLLHRMDDRMELAQDIEESLDCTVLGQIPLVDVNALKDRTLLITNLDQYDFFAEAIRGVRSAVLFGSQGSNKQVLIATSAVPGDGKTTFTVNFAATLALAGNKVLLVDADLRRGNVHNYFKSDRGPGFS